MAMLVSTLQIKTVDHAEYFFFTSSSNFIFPIHIISSSECRTKLPYLLALNSWDCLECHDYRDAWCQAGTLTCFKESLSSNALKQNADLTHHHQPFTFLSSQDWHQIGLTEIFSNQLLSAGISCSSICPSVWGTTVVVQELSHERRGCSTSSEQSWLSDFHLQMFMIQHWKILLTKPNGTVMEVSAMLKLENPDKFIPLFVFIPHRL